MIKQDIERIIEAQGYYCQIREYSVKGGGTQEKVFACIQTKPKRFRSFGNLEDVMMLDQDEFARIVTEKFAEVER